MHATCPSSARTAISGGGAKAEVNAESSGLGRIGASFPRVIPRITEKGKCSRWASNLNRYP